MLKRGMRPSHPGAGLPDEFATLGWTIAEAAKQLGVSRSQLHRVCRGNSAISPTLAYRLEIGVGGVASPWLAMQATDDLWRIRHAPPTNIKASRPKFAA